MKKQPEQTAQTRQDIINAFWVLAEKHGLDGVTISEVTRTAGLNRCTFYVYFNDPKDLISQAEDEVFEDFQMQIQRNTHSDPDFPKNLSTLIHNLTNAFGMNENKFYFLLSKNGDPNFLDRVRAEIRAAILSVLPTDDGKTEQDSEHISAYLSSAFIGTLLHWHENGRKIPLEDLKNTIHNMSLLGLLGLNLFSDVNHNFDSLVF